MKLYFESLDGVDWTVSSVRKIHHSERYKNAPSI